MYIGLFERSRRGSENVHATIRMRSYQYPRDFRRVSNFLVQHYRQDQRDGNWLQPAWEYMHYHPALDESALDRIGIWEDGGEKDLNIVVEAPDGHFVSYSGTWYEGTNRYAYVEPVATDPDYRRRGLGRAAVLEGIRCCGGLGATVAYVGSDLAFYVALGFDKIYTSQCWTKTL